MTRKRKKREKRKKRIRKLFFSCMFAIFASMMIISGIKIFEWIEDNEKSKDINNQIKNTISIDENSETIDKYNVDFKSLKKKNSDTIAWLRVNGTDIDYPVVKTTDNDFYMTHSFDKSYNSAGWVFMDCNNKFDGTDNNMVIFAHNRRDGSLFGSLKNILTEKWQSNNNNFIIPFITEKEKEEYQVFSVYKIKKEDYYITTNFSTDKSFQEFINIIKSRSVKDFNVEVTTKDNILTLSTCADNNKYRVVLHAKKIRLSRAVYFQTMNCNTLL